MLNSSTVPLSLFEAKLLYESYQPETCDSTRFCEFKTPADAQIGPLEPKSRNLTKTHHMQKSFLTEFSEPNLWRDTPLGRKCSSNNYLGLFLISSKTNFRIRRTSHSKTRLATHPRAPRRRCIPPLFRYYSSKQGCSTSHVKLKRATAPDFANLRRPWTPKSGLSSQNPEI